MNILQIAVAGFLALVFAGASPVEGKTKIKALYIPLADHYAAAVVAHAKYRGEMKKCDYDVQMMISLGRSASFSRASICTIIGRPWIGLITFIGSRVDLRRAVTKMAVFMLHPPLEPDDTWR